MYAHVYLAFDWPVSPVSHRTVWYDSMNDRRGRLSRKEPDTAGRPVTASENIDFFDRPPVAPVAH